MGNKLYLRVMSKFTVEHGQKELTSINKMLFSKLEMLLSVETVFCFKVPHFGAM